MRVWAAPFGLLAVVGLAGCFATTRRTENPVSIPEIPAPPPPTVPQTVPDALPRVEPRARYGNPPFYEVFGKRYYVLSSSAAYAERGVASWYGPGFHKERTSTGEPYDMYGMTAAHKTLPLPAYVRVTNLQNGRSVVVRVNDRGPFVGNRIIDLSFTAASRLDMLRNGTAMVEVRALDPAAPSTGTPPSDSPRATLFVQAGAFADPANAERLAAKLRGGGYGNIFVRDDIMAGRKMYRVRIGPVPDVPEFDRIVAALERAGVHDAHLALD
ncbi:MAG: septal ring lytic transglycosylase RlpA family protein [Pseudomonadota bacterium]|nr:septal ring lytic transglycosylase RlpA family protein [Pseudomonadota bacterium]